MALHVVIHSNGNIRIFARYIIIFGITVEMHCCLKIGFFFTILGINRIKFYAIEYDKNLPVNGCVGISAPFIPCDSNKFLTFEQLLSGFAAAASAPFTSFGVVDDNATFCAAAIVIVTNRTITFS